ncbi:MAG: type II toxin-antitoxin system HicB family antitoxin [Actinomycetota bacterium]|nr:type II toxin-antitoxin system HicB family antitoxin [Actinomycetota bacterium]
MDKLEEFEIILTPQPEGGFTVTVPELPDVVTEGDTREEAIDMAREAIEGYLETVANLGYPIRRGIREHIIVHAS